MASAPSLARIEKLNYAIGGVVVIVSVLALPHEFALGVAVGVALTCLNFLALRRLVVRWTADAAAGRPGNAQLLMVPKMAALMGLIVLALAFLPINAVALTAGFSIFIPSILIETLSASMRAPSPPPTSETDTHG
jgi:hypothetical protein